jgi:hypothetical protein
MTNPRGPSGQNSLTQEPDTSLAAPSRSQVEVTNVRVLPRFKVNDAIFKTLETIQDLNIPTEIEELIFEVGYGDPQTTDFLVSVYQAIGEQKFIVFTQNLTERGREILLLLDQHFDNKIQEFINAVVQGENYLFIGLSKESFELIQPKFTRHIGVYRIYIEAGKKGPETVQLLFARIEGLDESTIWDRFEEAKRNLDQFLNKLNPEND